MRPYPRCCCRSPPRWRGRACRPPGANPPGRPRARSPAIWPPTCPRGNRSARPRSRAPARWATSLPASATPAAAVRAGLRRRGHRPATKHHAEPNAVRRDRHRPRELLNSKYLNFPVEVGPQAERDPPDRLRAVCRRGGVLPGRRFRRQRLRAGHVVDGDRRQRSALHRQRRHGPLHFGHLHGRREPAVAMARLAHPAERFPHGPVERALPRRRDGRVRRERPSRSTSGAFNNLYGFQLGADADVLDFGGPLQVKCLCRAGAFGNFARQNIHRVDTGPFYRRVAGRHAQRPPRLPGRGRSGAHLRDHPEPRLPRLLRGDVAGGRGPGARADRRQRLHRRHGHGRCQRRRLLLRRRPGTGSTGSRPWCVSWLQVPSSSVSGRAKRRKSPAAIAQVSQRGEIGWAWPA